MTTFREMSEAELIMRNVMADYIIRMHISNLANALDEYRHIWDLGDGYGGWVKERLAAQIRSRGFAWEPSDLGGYEPSQMTSKLRRIIFERDSHECVNCGSSKLLEVDHIYPASRGGSNDPENLQLLCRACNRSKLAMTMEEWESSGKAAECRPRQA